MEQELWCYVEIDAEGQKDGLIGGHGEHVCVRFVEICLTGIWKAREVETVCSENKEKALGGREDLPDRM